MMDTSKPIPFRKTFAVSLIVPLLPIAVAWFIALLPLYAVALIIRSALKAIGPSEDERMRFWRRYINGEPPIDAGRKP